MKIPPFSAQKCHSAGVGPSFFLIGFLGLTETLGHAETLSHTETLGNTVIDKNLYIVLQVLAHSASEVSDLVISEISDLVMYFQI